MAGSRKTIRSRDPNFKVRQTPRRRRRPRSPAKPLGLLAEVLVNSLGALLLALFAFYLAMWSRAAFHTAVCLAFIIIFTGVSLVWLRWISVPAGRVAYGVAWALLMIPAILCISGIGGIGRPPAARLVHAKPASSSDDLGSMLAPLAAPKAPLQA